MTYGEKMARAKQEADLVALAETEHQWLKCRHCGHTLAHHDWLPDGGKCFESDPLNRREPCPCPGFAPETCGHATHHEYLAGGRLLCLACYEALPENQRQASIEDLGAVLERSLAKLERKS